MGAITIGGLGILVWQLYEYIRQRRREQLEDAIYDVFARTGDLPEQPTPAELTAGINAKVAPAVKAERGSAPMRVP